MKSVLSTGVFKAWLSGLKDRQAKVAISARIKRIQERRLFGDVEPVGGGVSELRFHIGAGYRVYFVQRGAEVVILLAGGTKASQKRDIANALEMAQCIEGVTPWIH